MPPNDDPSTSAPGAAAAAGPSAPPPGAGPSGLAGEPEAWAQVLAAWDDEAAHRAYLARFADLEGLALAGGRYRAVLVERPGDALAARFREEVVKRATVQGLASLPRAAPREGQRRARRALIVAAAVLSGAMTVWAAARLAALLGGGAP